MEDVGNFYGTGILGAVDHFLKKYGPAAAHEAIARLSPSNRVFVDPHAPRLGILAARKYPYPFVGELIRNMAQAVKLPEEPFVREMTSAGIDATVNTVARVILRYMVTPEMIAERAQELWNTFHDAGVVTAKALGEHEYYSEITEWPNHDPTVCRICAEARRRLVERTGAKDVRVTRTACLAWGHDRCAFRVVWA
jgi:hypothetical protein